MALQGLHALTPGDDDAGAMIVQFVADGLRNLRHILRQGHYHAQMLVAESQPASDSLKLVGTGRILAPRHASGQVVADDDRDVSILVDGIKQPRHAAVGEG